MAIETPIYKVLKKEGKFELREYKGYITASVLVEAKDYNTAANSGFRIIADYIFGNNSKLDKVAMTAPVLQKDVATSEKIAMTAPVTISKSKNQYKISFIMPQKYTLKTLPLPNNNKVKIDETHSYKAAVVRFSGFVNEKTILKKINELREWVKKEKLTTNNAIQTARYDPPWTPWFLRRNEILITVL